MPSQHKRKRNSPIYNPHENLRRRLIEHIPQTMPEEFARLRPAERKIVEAFMAERLADPDKPSSIHRELYARDYLRQPVSPREFFSSPDYFGKSCGALHETWLRDLDIVLSPMNNVAEWYLAGSIGGGKTTVAAAALGYKFYRMSCLKSPQLYYGTGATSIMYFAVYSISKAAAQDTAYAKVLSYIDNSPYFRDEFPRNPKLTSMLDWPQHYMRIVVGSRLPHVLGRDLYAFCYDEADVAKISRDEHTGQYTGLAIQMYNECSNRIYSRYVTEGADIPGLMMLMSSATVRDSFLQQRIQAANPDVPDTYSGFLNPNVYLSRYPIWEVKEKGRYSSVTFKVERGDRLHRTKILAEGEEPRDGSTIIDVPVTLKKIFAKDPEKGLRDIVGLPSANTNPFFSDPQWYTDAVNKHFVHPFKRQEITLREDDKIPLSDYWLSAVACTTVRSLRSPRLNPGAPRYIHIDQSLSSDATGLAMVHSMGQRDINDAMPDGTIRVSRSPQVVVDFMLRILPPGGGQKIPLSKITDFVLFLRQFYNIRKVSYDGFQSAYPIQVLKSAKMNAGVISVDRTDVPYQGLLSLFQNKSIVIYDYAPFRDELLDLVYDVRKKKVDHPDRKANGEPGQKDVSDGLAGAVSSLMNDKYHDHSVVASESGKTVTTNQAATVAMNANKESRYDWEKERADAR